ncbi:MAG: response regulator [Aliidiomarina sp.]|uniref:response regulator n=1 Tax=Aliidiomarina sp. TaxID=1872439 RepID=UPI0025B92751|nr:response regulator [Aliidiomarina sp.]MCH8502224.1 response regulator [Aliidiomarina sp.]
MNRKVLIIEDDRVYASILDSFLSERGYSATHAPDGETALRLLKQIEPDVVLCDLSLPDMSGLAILERLVSSPDPIPVIVISASDRMADIREAVRLGAADYLVKPVAKLDVLEYALESCLDRVALEKEHEHDRWEFDDHLDVLFQDDSVVQRLSYDLIRRDQLAVGPFQIIHHVGPRDEQRLWLDYYRLPNDQLIMVLARAQALSGQDILALLVLKTLFNPLLRATLAETTHLLMHPPKLLARLNSELCHSRIRAAFDMVVVWIDTRTGVARWSQAGDKILLSHEGKPDLALGIWGNATYRQHQVPLDRQGFYMACEETWLRAQPRS